MTGRNETVRMGAKITYFPNVHHAIAVNDRSHGPVDRLWRDLADVGCRVAEMPAGPARAAAMAEIKVIDQHLYRLAMVTQS